MPRKKRKAKASKRRITARPVYLDKPDTKALSKALIYWALNEQGADDRSRHAD